MLICSHANVAVNTKIWHRSFIQTKRDPGSPLAQKAVVWFDRDPEGGYVALSGFGDGREEADINSKEIHRIS